MAELWEKHIHQYGRHMSRINSTTFFGDNHCPQHFLTVQPDCPRKRGKIYRTGVIPAQLGLQAAPCKWPVAGKWNRQRGTLADRVIEKSDTVSCCYHMIPHRTVGPCAQPVQGWDCCAFEHLSVVRQQLAASNWHKHEKKRKATENISKWRQHRINF